MKADEKKLSAFLKKLNDCSCPLCDNKNWGVAEKVFYVGEFDKGGFDLGGSRFPVIPMTCTNCGYTMFLSALVSGILENADGRN